MYTKSTAENSQLEPHAVLIQTRHKDRLIHDIQGQCWPMVKYTKNDNSADKTANDTLLLTEQSMICLKTVNN